MAFWTYMLRCSDGSYYVGHSDDLEHRVAQHQAGSLPGYTHIRRPVELIWSEDCGTREEALAFERRLKGWSHAKKEALIRGDWDAIRTLARQTALRDEASTSSASPQDERDGGKHPAAPVIILVRSQLGENIGKAARAMLNFGLTELRLVAPRDGWPNPAAWPAASGADAVLARAAVYDTLADAVADCAQVYATTVRRRGVTKPVVTPARAAAEIRGSAGRTAILFGPERSGLETEDVAVARAIVTVPINPAFGSLNLAQAVVLVAYEWSKGAALAQPPMTAPEPPAPQAELDGMIAQLDAMLDAAGFYFPANRAAGVRRTIRSVLTKPGWTAQEVRTLRGVLSAIDRPRPARG